MDGKTKLIITGGGLVLVAFLFVIALGEHGAVDLYQLTLERDRLHKVTSNLRNKNEILYETIERLKNDPEFVENIARTELGMTGKGEVVILKKRR